MRQKTIKRCLITVFILFFVFLVNVVLALGLDAYLINLLPQKKLPSKFSNYKKLSETKSFNNHNVALFYKGEGAYQNLNTQIFVISKEKIIVKVVAKTESYDHGGGNIGKDFSNIIFKLDSFGSILDKITFKTSISSQSDYGNVLLLNKQMVNIDLLHYQTWPTDGNKTKKHFIAVNKDLTWDTKKTTKYFHDKILPNYTYLAPFYAWRDQSIPTDRKQSLIYFINNQWHILYGVDKDTYRDYDLTNLKINNENIFGKIPNNKLDFKYFQKVSYNSEMAGQTQGNSPYTYYYWKGIGYINVLFEKDTLRLKKENTYLDSYDTQKVFSQRSSKENLKETENALREQYGFYSNPYLKFALISNDENNNLYIIKKN